VTPSGLYRTLLSSFGRQGWWPTTPKGGTKPVYTPGKGFPKSEGEKFEIAVGAILTQNAAWTNVEMALAELHRRGAVRPDGLLRTPESRLAGWVRPSGYFKQKAKKLRRLAGHLADNGRRLGPLLEGPLQGARERLLSLWGVGPETADSILLYAGGRPVFVVDAYTLRIGRRIGWYRTGDYETVRRFFESRLPRSPKVYAELHALFVALAKHFCRPEPLCAGCPAKAGCRTGRRRAGSAGRQGEGRAGRRIGRQIGRSKGGS